MTRIWERLYLGSLADAEQLSRSNPVNIDVVVSLCEEAVSQQRPGLVYKHIPIAASGPIPAARFRVIMATIGKSVRIQRVLVHCFAGMSRSPILVAAWLDRCGYAQLNRGIKEISEVREIDPCPELLSSIEAHLRADDGLSHPMQQRRDSDY